MADCESQNIKKLQETNEINLGDFLLVETINGTQIIDFENFVITEYNTTFRHTLSSQSLNITNNTSNVTTLSTNQNILTGFWSPNLTTLGTMSSVGIGLTDIPGEMLTVAGNVSAVGSCTFDSISSIGTTVNYFKSPIGIGLTNPTYPLDVYSTDTDLSVRVRSAGTDSSTRLRLKNDAQEYSIKVNGSESDRLEFIDESAGEIRYMINQAGQMGVGTVTPTSTFQVGTISACMTMGAYTEPTVLPAAEADLARIFVKAGKLIIKWKDGGTTRYKHFPLSGTGVTWVHTEGSEPNV